VEVFVGSDQLINGTMRLGEDVHGENGLGGVQLKKSPRPAISENGLQRTYEKIMQQDGQVIWANTGSLTNICILLLAYPQLKTKLKEIVIMGGAIGKGNITPAAEFNIFFDPFALKNVLKYKGDIPLVMIPLETTHMNIAGQDVYDHFKGYSAHPFGLGLYNTMLCYQDFYINVNRIPFPPYHDPLTIFYILHPEEFEVRPANVDVDTHPTSYGRTNIAFSYPGVSQVQSTTLVTTNLHNKVTKFWGEMLRIMDLIFSPEMQKTIGIEY
jgi:inosine-uridine nucleoside N-ribohydrolase